MGARWKGLVSEDFIVPNGQADGGFGPEPSLMPLSHIRNEAVPVPGSRIGLPATSGQKRLKTVRDMYCEESTSDAGRQYDGSFQRKRAAIEPTPIPRPPVNWRKVIYDRFKDGQSVSRYWAAYEPWENYSDRDQQRDFRLDESQTDPVSWEDFFQKEGKLERESLELDVKNGVIPNPNLCRLCRALQLVVPGKDGCWTWRLDRGASYGNWNHLCTRRWCAICQLIFSLITLDSNRRLHPSLAKIDAEMQDVRLECIMDQDNLGEMRQFWQLRSLLRGFTENPTTVPDGGELVKIETIRAWLNSCEAGHRECCQSFSRHGKNSDDVPLLLINVRDRCLVRATSAERYFTLSYVWGRVQSPVTLKANVQDRFQVNSLVSSGNFRTPQTIEDAMRCVETLDELYLWVDSLCIVQDDTETKHRDIEHMDKVYGKSIATIVALHGVDADAGLPGIMENTRTSEFGTVVRVAANGSLRDFSTTTADDEPHHVIIKSTPSPLDLLLESTAWNTRGWILQEQLLSRRCLYFSSEYVYFQCQREIFCEHEHSKLLHNVTGDETLGLSETRVQPSYHGQVENPLASLSQNAPRSEIDYIDKVFDTYKSVVQLYTKRKLTVSADIINAVSGILSVIAGHFQSPFVAGLPGIALELALLWSPLEPISRGTCYIRAQKDTGSTSETRVPSWSWAGWDGAVEYRLPGLRYKFRQSILINTFYCHHHGTLREYRTSEVPGRFSTSRRNSGSVFDVEGELISTSNDRKFEHGDKTFYGPDLGPYVLQFWAEAVDTSPFYTRSDQLYVYLSNGLQDSNASRQAIFRLEDSRGRHCGIVFESQKCRFMPPIDRNRSQVAVEKLDLPRFSEFIAISQAKVVLRAGEERPTLTATVGEAHVFDNNWFPERGPRSGVVNVLIVEWDFEIAERISVGQIHAQAWKEANPKRKHIRLA